MLRLWAADELIAEEEKALATRLYDVQWRARRRYPHALTGAIWFEVEFGLAGLTPAGAWIRPDQLEWSWRIRGAPRASLEQISPWQVSEAPVRFASEAADLPPGPDVALAFQARLRTAGLTSRWELDLPQVPFRFERDPMLRPESILAAPDTQAQERLERGVRLEIGSETVEDAGAGPVYLPIDPAFALVGQPRVRIDNLPCDLAHRATLELDDSDAPRALPAGEVVHLTDPAAAGSPKGTNTGVAICLEPATEPLRLQPGTTRIRLVLEPDPHLGWAHAGVRSVWPERIATDWQEVRIVRR